MNDIRVEKRRHKRYTVNSEAEIYSYTVETPAFVCKGILTDISLGGLCFETNIEFKHNDVLVKFRLPAVKKMFSIRCKLVRIEKDSMRIVYGLKIFEAKFAEKLSLFLYFVMHKNVLR